MAHHDMKRCSLPCSAHTLQCPIIPAGLIIRAEQHSTDPLRLSLGSDVPLVCVELDSTTNKMQCRAERFEARRTGRGTSRRATTYLAKIAVVLQDAPGKMLLFTQLMDRMTPLISGNQKSAENNIRVCLSFHKCFVKVPEAPDSLNSKRSYWKLDCSQITSKMVRRHFKGLLQLFPELAHKMDSQSFTRVPERHSRPLCPKPEVPTTQVRCQEKFSGPFSIESLLKREGPSARTGVQLIRAEQQPQPRNGPLEMRSFSCFPQEPPFLHPSFVYPSICPAGGSTHRGLTHRTAPLQTEPSIPIYTRTCPAPLILNTHSGFVTYALVSL